MATIPEALAVGLGHHEGGRLREAEQIYRQILAVDPNHADAWHLLGAIAFQTGKHEVAVEDIRRAIELIATESAVHLNLGNAFLNQGKLKEAVACFQWALKLKPDLPEAHSNLANAFQGQGKLDEAVAHFRRALELKPDHAEGHYDLGNVLQQQGKLDEAVAGFRRTLELKPDLAEAWSNLGAALYSQGKLDEAVDTCCRALQLNPDLPEAHNNLGAALQAVGKLNEAVRCHRRALDLRPDDAVSYNNLGNAFRALEKLDEAVESYRRALELKPDFVVAHKNLGGVLQSMGKLDEAVASYCRALELKPDYAEAHSNLGTAFMRSGRFEAASTCCARALELEADCPSAHVAQASLKLLKGNFESGWPEYEWRWKTKEFGEPDFSQPNWDGNPLERRTVLFHIEQGLGDTMQFVRYAAVVKRQNVGASVVVECQRPLAKLLAGCPGIDRLVAQGDELPAFDVHASLLSVPGIVRTSLDTIPAEVPYLFADPALVDQWHKKLEPLHGVRIGINWRGRPVTRYRDIPLEMFAALAEVPGVRLVSLQKGEGRGELVGRLPQWADAHRSPADAQCSPVDLGDDFDTVRGAFMDTAAVMMNLDLVITSDTAIPHLAGALGVPVWVALPYVPDWRWLLERSDSPWYPTMRLFRQQQPGDWAGVFAEIEGALRRKLGQ